MAESHPRLRPLDVQHVLHAGRPYYLLRDPQQIADGQMLIPQHLGPILALCDGTLSSEAIGDSVRRSYGLPVSDAQVAELLDALDAAALLDNGVYAQRVASARAAWRAAKARPMAHAGAGYAESKRGLARQLNSFLSHARDVEPAKVEWRAGVGLLSPHIDYRRGGHTYARVWKRAVREAEVAVVFGTDHYGDDPVTLTRVPYATPYGVLPLDLPVLDGVEQAVAALAGAEAPYAGELRHRTEHSLELVLTWLHHMRGGMPLPVAPILVGSIARGRAAANGLPAAVVEAVRRATAGRRALFVASGDLAHVGPAFQGEPLDGAGKQRIRHDDGRLIQQMERGDAEGFLNEIRRTDNGNNVCGVAPIYFTMGCVAAAGAHNSPGKAQQTQAAIGAGSNGFGPASASGTGNGRVSPLPLEGETVSYAVCPADEEESSIVSIAGLFFRGAA
jgi:AmmeMemoRadiSam system protein B